MAAAPKENLGMIPCPCCKRPTALKRSATGKLSFQCQHMKCEASGFADVRTGAAAEWLSALPKDEQPAPAPAPAKPTPAAKTPAAPAPTPIPPPKAPPRAGFSLGDLK